VAQWSAPDKDSSSRQPARLQRSSCPLTADGFAETADVPRLRAHFGYPFGTGNGTHNEAERKYNDEAAIHHEMAELEKQHRAGEIDDETFETR
jgi:hypothetical protein